MFRDALMHYLNASLVVQIVLAIYFVAVVWFPLGAWNNQPGKNFIEVVQSGEAPLAAFGFVGGANLDCSAAASASSMAFTEVMPLLPSAAGQSLWLANRTVYNTRIPGGGPAM